MFKSKLVLLVMAGGILLSGCASVPMASKEQDTTLKSFSKPSPDKSGIYIYRDTFAGQALKKNIYIDGVLLGESANKIYFYDEIAPGAHKVSTESEFSDNEIELTTEGGKNYYVEQYIKMGVFVGGANLKVVSEDEGKKGVRSCNLATSNHVAGFTNKTSSSLPASSTTQYASSTSGNAKGADNMRHFYNAEKVAASLGCASTTFVSSGPGVEFYSTQCGDSSKTIRCDFGNCAAQ